MSELDDVRDALAASAKVRERDLLVVIRALLEAARWVVADVGRVWLFTGADRIEHGASVGADSAAVAFEVATDGPWARVARERRAVTETEGTAGVPSMVDLRGILYVPLVAGDRAVAVAAFARARATWTENEALLLEIASAPVAYLLGTAAAEPATPAEGPKRAITDEVSGVYNAAFLDMRLPALIAQTEALGRPLTVIAIELDEEAKVRQSVGTAAADAALREFGAILRSKLRGDDLAVRYGAGFALLLPETDAFGALRTVERLRSAARSETSRGPLGFSAGIAGWRIGRDAAALLAAAREKLAEASALGLGEVRAESPS